MNYRSYLMGSAMLRAPEDGAGSGAGDGAAAAAGAGGSDAGTQGAAAGAQGQQQQADWRASITDPKLAEFAKTLESPVAAAKAAFDLRQKYSTAIFKPGEKATDEERAAFRKALGVPEKAEGYQVKPKDGMEQFYTSDVAKIRLGKVATILHKHDVRGEAMQDLIDWYGEEIMGQGAAMQKADRENLAKSTEALKAEWGADFDRNDQASKVALKEVLGDKIDDFLALHLNDGTMAADHPLLRKAFAGLGLRLAESGTGGALTAQDRDTLTEQANAARANRDKAMASGDRAAALKWDEQERTLLGKIHGNTPVVGQEGRTV